MTIPQKTEKYIDGLIQGKTRHDSAIDAGYSEAVADKPNQQIESRESFIRAIDARISSCKIADKINQGLEATKTTYASNNGVITDERIDPDFNAQHKFLETLIRIKGYADKAVEKLDANPDIDELKKEIRMLVKENGFHDE